MQTLFSNKNTTISISKLQYIETGRKEILEVGIKTLVCFYV